MNEEPYEKIYEWNKLMKLFEEFLPELVNTQDTVEEQGVISNIPDKKKVELEEIGFSQKARDPKEVTRQLIDDVYPYRMKANHPRYFNFIPNVVSPYSVFGEFINSIYNPFGGGFSISGGTATLEIETIKWMGDLIGYDKERLGGQFVSGGSMANLNALIAARDDKLSPEEFIKGTAYVSDQTHSSVAKAIHLMGLPRENVRIVPSKDDYKIDSYELRKIIRKDIKDGYKPFLLIGSAGTTNTGSIDNLEELGEISKEYNLWYHVDGAYGASVLLSSHKELLKGIEKSDSVSWDGHKWLFQTYGCAAIICKDKNKLIDTFSANPEYLKDVESTDEDINFWDIGMELTKPARGMKLWFTLQTVGTYAIKDAIDQGFRVAEWIEEEVRKYDDFEIVSHANMGIVNFRYRNDKYTEEELDEINRSLSREALEKNYASFLTTTLQGKVVLRFCANHPATRREDINTIVLDIRKGIEELTK